MEYARLGRTGLTVSRICLGTVTFGSQCSEPESHAILDHAVELGVDFIDTADNYPFPRDASGAGRTEEILGHWLIGRRSNFIVATKSFGKMGPDPWDGGNSRRHILDAVDNSLRRLKTDWIDLYQLHHDDPEVPLDETLEAMDQLVRSGKVRYIGCSNWSAYRIARAIGRSDVRGLARFVAVQPQYSLIQRESERDVFPLSLEEGLGVIVWGPMAGGLLTGKHDRTKGPAAGTRFAIHPLARGIFWRDELLDSVDGIKQIAEEAGMPLPTLAVAWVLSQPAVTAPIVGATSAEQLDVSLAAVDVTLSEPIRVRLDEITRHHRRG